MDFYEKHDSWMNGMYSVHTLGNVLPICSALVRKHSGIVGFHFTVYEYFHLHIVLRTACASVCASTSKHVTTAVPVQIHL